MNWLGLYTATALVVGAALFVLAEFQRDPGTPPPRCPGVSAFVAGLLWPLLVVGAAQVGLLFWVRRRVQRRLSRQSGPVRAAQKVSSSGTPVTARAVPRGWHDSRLTRASAS